MVFKYFAKGCLLRVVKGKVFGALRINTVATMKFLADFKP
jgi:hypothetical protein